LHDAVKNGNGHGMNMMQLASSWKLPTAEVTKADAE
jgi:hypothetical protein